jgi:hypothetical protein
MRAVKRLTGHAEHCMYKPTGEYAGRAICGEVFRSAAASRKVFIAQLEAAGWTKKIVKGETHWFCPTHKHAPLTMEQKFSTAKS